MEANKLDIKTGYREESHSPHYKFHRKKIYRGIHSLDNLTKELNLFIVVHEYYLAT